MNLNTGFFAAYNHRRKQTNIGYHLPTTISKSARSPSVESTYTNESFLPSIATNNNNNQDGHRPYRRNDFANNHLFVAKKKLARIFLDQPSMDIQSKSELIHLFDQHESKHKNRRINKINKKQENNSDAKSTPILDQDVHLSIVNLIMKPSLPSSHHRDPFSAISHRRTQVPRPSIEWINPAINQHVQSPLNYTNDDDLQPNTIINELIDKNPDIVNSTSNPLDSSLAYVKSILSSTATQHR